MIRKPVYDDSTGQLTGHLVTRYVVTPPAARQTAPVTLDAIKALLKTELAARTTALEGKLAAYSQRAAEQAERQQLVPQLAVHGWSEQECASLPVATLRKVVQLVAFGAQEAAEADLPADCPTWT